MAFSWKNLFNPVEDAEYEDECNPFETENNPRRNTHRMLSLKDRAMRLRKVIDPKGDPKDNLADEVKYLADCLKMTFPVGATVPQQLDIMDEKVLGVKKAKVAASVGAAESIGDAVDRMVGELKLAMAPDDDTFKKLECVEKHLGIDSEKAAELSLIDRVKVPYQMIFGSS